MKKIKSLTALFLLSFIAFCNAQDTTSATQKRSDRTPSLGVIFSPDYCTESFSPVKGAAASVNYYSQDADSMNSVVSPGLGFTVGIDALFPFNDKRFSIKTGIYYAVRTISYNGFAFENGIYPAFATYRFDSPRKEKTSVIEIPIALDYSILSEKPNRKFHTSFFCRGNSRD
jgi:hypothetical protein